MPKGCSQAGAVTSNDLGGVEARHITFVLTQLGHETIVESIWSQTIGLYGKSNNSISFPSNKRSRTKTVQQLAQYDSKRHRVEYQEDDNDRTVNLARENRNMEKEGTTTIATNESDMFTKKLERLLRGDETIEVMVGENSLSHILKDVPKI